MLIAEFAKNLGRLESRHLRWLIIALVLGLSAYANHLAQRVNWILIAGAAGALIFGVVAHRSMPLVLTLVLLTSATTGLVIGTGTSTPLPFALLAIAGLTLVWILKMVVFERQVRLKPSPLNAPLLLFLGAAAISWLAGNGIWDWRIPAPESNLWQVQAGQYALFALSFAAAFLTAHQDLKEKDLQRWTWIVVAIGFAGMIFELATGSTRTREMGITGALLVWAVVLVGAQLLFNPNFKGWPRTAAIAGLLVWGFWAYRNLIWKGGWAPALVGLVILLFFKNRRLFLVIALAAALLVVLNWTGIYQMLFAPEVDSGSSIRPLYWLDVIHMTSRSPFLGLGLVNYFYYWLDPGFTPLSRMAAGWDRWNAWVYAPPSHNMFVDIYAQTGLVGIVLFVWGMVAALWIAYRVFKNLPAGFLKAFGAGVLCGFAAMLFASFFFADWLIPYVYNITITGFRHSVYSWILFGSVLGLFFKMQEKKIGERT